MIQVAAIAFNSPDAVLDSIKDAGFDMLLCLTIISMILEELEWKEHYRKPWNMVLIPLVERRAFKVIM